MTPSAYQSMRRELDAKLAEITPEQASTALQRLEDLESAKPTGGQLARGALAGAAAGPISLLASKGVSGEALRGLQSAVAAPGLAGKARGLLQASKGAGRMVLERSAGGAALGAIMPNVKHRLDTEAEMAKLREFMGTSNTGPVRGVVKRTLGV
jgi:hypothetical protein